MWLEKGRVRFIFRGVGQLAMGATGKVRKDRPYRSSGCPRKRGSGGRDGQIGVQARLESLLRMLPARMAAQMAHRGCARFDAGALRAAKSSPRWCGRVSRP